jgi:tight adherence protein C
MNEILEFLSALPDENPLLMMSGLVFLAAATLTFSVMAMIRVRNSVKRRASGLTSADPTVNARSLRYASAKAAQRLIDYTTQYYGSGTDGGDVRNLRRRLIQAGFLDPRATALFFIARIALAIALAGACFMLLPSIMELKREMYWLIVWVSCIAGYFIPSVYLDRRINSRRNEHRAGFPDFMDLLVVCADAGLSMEAALDRVGRELGDSYPSLSSNIYMATLELRAGRTLSETLEQFAERLSLDEARSFATLLQQSAELGSSLTDALRVYSDDMRHKRLSLAEEKAYSLPAKLSVPLMLCIFPVVIIVIMLPVFVRYKTGTF